MSNIWLTDGTDLCEPCSDACSDGLNCLEGICVSEDCTTCSVNEIVFNDACCKYDK